MCYVEPRCSRELQQVVEDFRIHAPNHTGKEIEENFNSLQLKVLPLVVQEFTVEYLPLGLSSEHVRETESPS